MGLRSIAERTGEVKRLWVDDERRRAGDRHGADGRRSSAGTRARHGLIELETGPAPARGRGFLRLRGWELVEELPIEVSDYPNALRFLKRYDDEIES